MCVVDIDEGGKMGTPSREDDGRGKGSGVGAG